MSFENIAGQFADIITDRERMQQQLSVSLSAVRRQLLIEILLGFNTDYETVEKQLKYVGANLLPSNYIVLLVKLEQPDKTETPAIARSVINVMADLVEQRISAVCIGCVTVLDNGLIAGILSFPYDRPGENMESALAVAENAVQDAFVELHETAHISVGEHYSAFSRISHSYQEALAVHERGEAVDNIMRYSGLTVSALQGVSGSQKTVKAKAVEEYLRIHFTDPMLSQTGVAEALGLSPSYVSRIFRHEMGIGFSEALASIRIMKAQELLSLPGASVSEVSEKIGYTSTHTFIRAFKKITGETPGKWMKGKDGTE